MLKQLFALAAACLIFTAPMSAQSASEIAKVKSGKSCPACNLFQADFSYQAIKDINLSDSRLRQASMSLSTMNGVNFSGANLSVANLFAGSFTNANFSKANMTNSTLVGAYFDGANFSGANLTGANLGGAELQLAMGLTQRQLNQACGDKHTKLRGGFTIPSCK